ncbi:hypothetical protein [Kutzneria kofuensis]|uniref:hypothetical protein n=1 Tax=Kutzneria kofuensis TaxID=103725 RepID=UPI0031ED0ED8
MKPDPGGAELVKCTTSPLHSSTAATTTRTPSRMRSRSPPKAAVSVLRAGAVSSSQVQPTESSA